MAQNKLDHEFLTTNCNESYSWATLIIDTYHKSVCIRREKLQEKSIEYMLTLCSKVAEDQALVKASKVLRICFQDIDVIQGFRNKYEDILKKIRKLMDRNERIINVHNNFSIIFVSLLLESSNLESISHEDLEVVANIYNL